MRVFNVLLVMFIQNLKMVRFIYFIWFAKSFLFLICCCIQGNSLPSTFPISEMNSLQSLYDSTNGTFWNWNSSRVANFQKWNFSSSSINPCTDNWFGIGCIDVGVQYHVHNLSLNSFNLVGQLPSDLANLEYLNHLDLSDNRLNGTIPSNIGSFPQLLEVNLSINSLSGTIPTEFSNLNTLSSLIIYDNLLTNWFGCLPSASGVNSLQVLDLGYNLFISTIPPEICYWNELIQFALDNNFLTSTLPDCMVDFSSLTVLQLNNNQISGLRNSIPDSLVYINIESNRFSGAVPAAANILNYYMSNNEFTGVSTNIFQNINVENIYLSQNYFSGTIPIFSTSSYYPNLANFDVSNNLFTGYMALNMSFLSSVKNLYMNNNRFSGPIPDTIGYLTEVVNIYMDNNQFSGELPSGFQHLQKCVLVSLNNNLLSGTMPSLFGEMLGLITLFLYNNQLSGTIPTEFSNLASLESFIVYNNKLTGQLTGVFDSNIQHNLLNIDVGNNKFTGPLPTEPFQVDSLQSFSAVSNCLTGSISDQICNAVSLTSLILDGLTTPQCLDLFFPTLKNIHAYSSNSLSDHGIPSCIFSMPHLETLHLSGNTIKSKLLVSNLSTTLSDISLSHNLLYGTIPIEIQQHSWTNLDLSYNKLKDTLTSSFAAPNNNSLFLQVNRISGSVPSSLIYGSNINILDGNIFTCSDNSELPHNDPQYTYYTCGSDSFNYALYTFIAVAGFAVGVCILLWYFYRTDINNSVNNMETNNCAKYPNIQQFHILMKNTRMFFSFVVGFILIIVLPVVSALSVYYRTYDYVVAWALSAVYMAGTVPTFVIFSVVLVFCSILGCFKLYCDRVIINTNNADDDAVIVNTKTNKKRSFWVIYSGYFILAAVISGNLIVVTMVNYYYNIIITQNNTDIVHFVQLLVALFKLAWSNMVVKSVLRIVQYKILSIDANFGVISVSVEVFIILLNNFLASFIATALVSTDCFYNLVVPPPTVYASYEFTACTAYLTNSTSGVSTCTTRAPIVRDTQYDPIFIYSYQCSSAFIAAYSNVFLFMFTIIAFGTPVFQMTCAYLIRNSIIKDNKYCMWVLNIVTPRILRVKRDDKNTQNSTNNNEFDKTDDNTSSRSNNSDKKALTVSQKVLHFINKDRGQIINSDLIILQLVSAFTIVLTFGTMVPAISVAALVALFSFTWYHQFIFDWYVKTNASSETQEQNNSSDNKSNTGENNGGSKSNDILNDNLSNITAKLIKSTPVIIPFVCVFYSFVFFDMLGYNSGFLPAIALPIVICGLPVIVFVMSFLYEYYWYYYNGSNADVDDKKNNNASKNSSIDHNKSDHYSNKNGKVDISLSISRDSAIRTSASGNGKSEQKTLEEGLAMELTETAVMNPIISSGSSSSRISETTHSQ